MKIDSAQLKQMRNSRGWTQQHLAEVSQLSLRTVQRAEKTGAVSQQTISALCSVFEVDRAVWKLEPELYRDSVLFKKRSWMIAILGILVFQLFALVATYVLVGELPIIWLKLLVVSDTGIFLFIGILFFTQRTHQKK